MENIKKRVKDIWDMVKMELESYKERRDGMAKKQYLSREQLKIF